MTVESSKTSKADWRSWVKEKFDTSAWFTMEAVYPVGSLYISTSSVDPGITLRIGTWVQVSQGRTLIGDGSGSGLTERVGGVEGGSEDAILPLHNHDLTDPGHTHPLYASLTDGNTTAFDGGAASNRYTAYSQSTTTGITLAESGESETDKNMPPYLVVYIWERTA